MRQGSVVPSYSRRDGMPLLIENMVTNLALQRGPSAGMRVRTAVVAVDSLFPGLAAPPQGQHKGYSPFGSNFL